MLVKIFLIAYLVFHIEIKMVSTMKCIIAHCGELNGMAGNVHSGSMTKGRILQVTTIHTDRRAETLAETIESGHSGPLCILQTYFRIRQ